MANLRLVSFTVVDSTHLSAKFNNALSPLIGIDNVTITSETNGVVDPTILAVEITSNFIEIITLPLITQATYLITFTSTDTVPFKSLNGNAYIINDGKSNRFFFIGPVEPNNPIKDSLTGLFKSNVYDLEAPSILGKYIDGISLVLSKALYTIGQTKNDNYLSFTVTDELKVRGEGAYDRLNQEGAYEIVRVASTPTEALLEETVTEEEFPDYPISLLSTNKVETLTVSNSDSEGSFNLKTLTINTSKFPVIILNSVTIVYNSILVPFSYDTTIYGYQVKNSKYDPDYAFTYVSLEENQFRLSDKVLENTLFSLENIASITIDYQYKNQGKIIDASTLTLDAVMSSGREVLPPIENVFNLEYAPIIDANNNDGELGDVSFLDPNAFPGSNTPHPAFLNEIPFRLDYLPGRIGEYSVDYATGTVYVFGEDRYKTGTGAYPPLALYNYRHSFQSEIDYVYDESVSDVVSLPNGSLEESPASISFSYEQVLIKGVDYSAEVHKEELSERVDNRIEALNIIRPLNFPITNVFRIFNETSGEIYRVSRWNESKIFFTYQAPPKILNIVKERAIFDDVTNETLFVSNTSELSPTLQIFKIFLQNNNIIAASEDALAHSQNTSLALSDTITFAQEFYYDPELTEAQNNAKITEQGDYQVNYEDGVIWVVVSVDQDLSIGTASYKRGYVKTQRPHIITVEDLYYKLNSLADKTRTFEYASFTDTLILPSTFDKTNEGLLDGDDSYPYQIYNTNIGVFDAGTFVTGVTDYVKYIRSVFEREDLINNTQPINFATSTTISGKTISVTSKNYSEYHAVELDGADYVVYTNTNLPYISSNINISVSVTRLSDSAELWDGSGIIETGTPFRLVLSGVNSPSVGDSVLITYSFEIADLSRVIVDYSRGDYLIDYSYLADEIIVSYEYGDNILDFSESTTVEPGDQYYVTYKAGALRDALLRNFGTLINIPILNNLNVDFERERYRDALMAAMQSFTQGPTVASLHNIVRGITHVPPEIIESAFRNWALGSSLLSQQKIETTGELEILPAKHGNGVLISEPDHTVTFPIISNLKLEEGTMEMWVIPQWNGIDNQASLSFEITKNGFVISDQEIFIGPGEDHPTSVDGVFEVINLNNSHLGTPNKNKEGIYIYLNPDSTGVFNRWYVDVVDVVDGYSEPHDGYVDGYSDGYSDGYVASSYIIKITTNGVLYDVKKSLSSISNNGRLISGNKKISYTITDAVSTDEGITFTADYEHFLFDFGDPDLEETNNALSQSDVLDLVRISLLTDNDEPLLLENNELLVI